MSVDPDGLALAQLPNFGMGGVGQASYGSDDALEVEFFWRTIYVPALVKGINQAQIDREEGEKKELWISIKHVPHTKTGLQDETVELVTDEHKQRFWRQWQFFQSGGQGESGMELKRLIHPLMDEAMIRHLKKLGIGSIEQLAHQPDHSVGRIGPHGYPLRKAALKYLDELKAKSHYSEAMQAAEANKAELEELRKLVETLTAPKADAKPEALESKGRNR